MDLFQLFSGGIPGVAGLVVEVGKSADVPTSALSVPSLRFEGEFAKTRAAMSERDAAIQMARSAECEAVLALREKQDLWEVENPGVEPSDEDPMYMAFIEPEYSAAIAAIRHTYELKVESNAFLRAEYERLRPIADAMTDEMAKDVMGEPEPTEVPTGS